jgi:hypothetical protein
MKETAEGETLMSSFFEKELAVKERGGKWGIQVPHNHRPNSQWRIYVLKINNEISR